MSLAKAYGIAARLAVSPESTGENLLFRRAVLETALQHLGETAFAPVLRCELSRAACHLDDLESAQAWLSKCAPNEQVVEVDGELRIALVALHAKCGDPTTILRILEPGGTAVPFRVKARSIYAAAYRVHAYEELGNETKSLELLRAGCAQYGRRVMLGRMRMDNIAPRARRRLVRFWVVLAAVAAAFVLAILVALYSAAGT